MSKQHFSAIAALCLSAGLASAIPARQGVISVTDTDGTSCNVRLYGDENFHYYVCEDDGSLLMRQGNSFIPADIDSKGRLTPSKSRVKASARATRLDAGAATAPRRVVPGLVEGTTFPPFGEQKVAVVLVEYQDVKFNLSDPKDYFTRLLNEEGFSDYYATGSARDWFINSSNGMFKPEFEIMGPVTLQKNQEYYGGNDAYGQDNAPQRMVIEACRQLNTTVDFSRFDRDGDGYIDNVFVVYAGRGEASGGSSDCVWPHAWTLNAAEPGSIYTFDNVRLNRYACCNEWELSDIGHGYRPVGIGTFVHEFSHVMGLPDLYTTNYNKKCFTPGAYSAMDYGPYNNDGCTPPQFSAWERASLGYIDLKPLPDNTNVAIKPLENNDAYILNTSDPNEYFIFENRQQNGWDTYIPGHGMLVWHVHYDADAWRTNQVNNDETYNRVDIIEADDIRDLATQNGDTFPGASGITSLSANTTPALLTWSGADTGISISDITELGERLVMRNGTGSADIETPATAEADNILPASFTAHWEACEGAVGYWVNLYTEQPSADSHARASYNDDMPPLHETRYVTGGTSCTFSGLSPQQKCAYTVTADDGFYGSTESEPVFVTTADPTFDYFRPELLAAESITETSFTARWSALDGATDYLLTVYYLANDTSVDESFGFDGGAEDLPEGWSCTSRASYGMASYCGNSIPSLRLSTDGDELISRDYPDGIESISFWHRGNGTTDSERLIVYTFSDNEWKEVRNAYIITEKGGSTVSVNINDRNARRVKIQFARPAKGAVAIDDVVLTAYGKLIPVTVDGYDNRSVGNVTAHTVSGLDTNRQYFYRVTATDGTLLSLPSYEEAVTTGASSEASMQTAPSVAVSVHNRTVSAESPFSVYNLTGATLASYIQSFELPSAGLYIIVPEGSSAIKIAVK